MKRTFRNVALGKKADLVLQVMAFLVALLLFWFTGLGPFALYLMGMVQTISALLWALYFRKGTPPYAGAAWIRSAFLTLAPLLALSFLAGTGAIVLVGYIMLVVGPMLGLSYFIITILEIRYYSRARKPYYLL